MKGLRDVYGIPAGGLVLCLLLWRWQHAAFLAVYLGAWWCVMGVMMGGLANVWLHNLTGGAWGEAVRAPLLSVARWVPLAALLFLPVLLGVDELYSWAGPLAPGAGSAAARWHGVVAQPEFKQHWLMPGFFAARSVAYLAFWSALAWLGTRPALQRSRALAAGGLLAYMFSLGLASLDWIMSLQPTWYSSVFGWLTGTGQMLAGLALGLLLAGRRTSQAVLPDLGNLLLMYVGTWLYLAYVQFLIIWAANLPHEISWYVQRRAMPWQALGWVLFVLQGGLPLVLLLSRRVKRGPQAMAVLAGLLLATHLLEVWWQVLPPLALPVGVLWWLAPGVAIALAALFWPGVREAAHA